MHFELSLQTPSGSPVKNEDHVLDEEKGLVLGEIAAMAKKHRQEALAAKMEGIEDIKAMKAAMEKKASELRQFQKEQIEAEKLKIRMEMEQLEKEFNSEAAEFSAIATKRETGKERYISFYLFMILYFTMPCELCLQNKTLCSSLAKTVPLQRKQSKFCVFVHNLAYLTCPFMS